MIVDKEYCMSSYLQFRTIAKKEVCFDQRLIPNLFEDFQYKTEVNNSDELLFSLESQIYEITRNRKAALALSGGIDSAILASFMPEGSKAYTFQCIVPGVEVINEIPQAKKYAEKNKLDHEVIPIYWEDFDKYTPILMKHKGAPIHSIEVQIYKAAKKAKEAGFDCLIFGESADVNYGGFSDLLAVDRTIGEFIDRYNYVPPHYVLKKPLMITEPYIDAQKNGYIDTHFFCRSFFYMEAMGSYTNACNCANISLEAPFAHTTMGIPLDIDKVRNGENKYLVREAFQKRYPGFFVPPKTPMPRPMAEWMKKWSGPTRPEFWPHCTDKMNGDQKWMVYCLEKFLNIIEGLEVTNK